jgi:hypothetical protein
MEAALPVVRTHPSNLDGMLFPTRPLLPACDQEATVGMRGALGTPNGLEMSRPASQA